MKNGSIIVIAVSSALCGDFFIEDNWAPRSAPTFTAYRDTTIQAGTAAMTVTISPKVELTKISSTLFGNNANAYMGNAMVTSPEAIKNLRNANISFMRLPGGNWSNIWMWDHTLPTDVKAEYLPMLKSAPQVNWTMKTDTLYALADSIGAKLQPCVNYSLARFYNGTDRVNRAASYAAKWVRDLKAKGKKAPYWEVGNENYGKWQAGYTVTGLDTISGTEYGKDFGIFADSMKAANPAIKVGAVIYTDETGYRNWSAGVLGSLNGKADYLIMHEYFTFANNINDVTANEVIASVSKIKEDRDNIDFMQNKYLGETATKLPVMVSEFNLRCGTKQTTMLAPIFQTMALHEFVKNRFAMVNIWDIANGTSADGDHGILARKDLIIPDNAPNTGFFTYYFMTKFTGDKLSETVSSDTTVRWYSSSFSDGNQGITAVNPSNTSVEVQINLTDFDSDTLTWFVLSADSILSPTVNINGIKPTLAAGGPELYDTIAPFRTPFVSGNSITVPPFSCLYGVLSAGGATTVLSNQTVKSSGMTIRGNSILFETSGTRTIELFNQKGQRLFSREIRGNTFEIPTGFAKGIYSVRVSVIGSAVSSMVKL